MVLNILRLKGLASEVRIGLLFLFICSIFFSSASFSQSSEGNSRPSLLDKLYQKSQTVKPENTEKPDRKQARKAVANTKNSSALKEVKKKNTRSAAPVLKKDTAQAPKKTIQPAKPPQKPVLEKKEIDTKSASSPAAINNEVNQQIPEAAETQNSQAPIEIANKHKDALTPYPKRYSFWLLDLLSTNMTGESRCVLKSNQAEVSDGYLDTLVSVEVYSDMVVVSSDSPIDLSYEGIGLQVDSFDLVSYDALLSEKKAVIFLESDILTAQMKVGNQLNVILGFWPVFPVDKSYSTDISLKGFSEAIKRFGVCEKSDRFVQF